MPSSGHTKQFECTTIDTDWIEALFQRLWAQNSNNSIRVTDAILEGLSQADA